MKRLTFALPALAAVVVLSGCAAQEQSGVTLAQSKSAAQLLRIEAADRVPPSAIDTTSEATDHSLACKSEDEDPDGLYRSWESSILITLDRDSAWRTGLIGETLAQTFIDDGWFVSGAKDGKDRTVVTKPGSVATITFVVDEGDELGAGATILIDSTGPCVLTGGPESAEVAALD